MTKAVALAGERVNFESKPFEILEHRPYFGAMRRAQAHVHRTGDDGVEPAAVAAGRGRVTLAEETICGVDLHVTEKVLDAGVVGVA
jgi:hypothetical protein